MSAKIFPETFFLRENEPMAIFHEKDFRVPHIGWDERITKKSKRFHIVCEKKTIQNLGADVHSAKLTEDRNHSWYEYCTTEGFNGSVNQMAKRSENIEWKEYLAKWKNFSNPQKTKPLATLV